jgi:hypothetical protein
MPLQLLNHMTRPLKPPQLRHSCDDFRRGVATLWIVGFGPALLALLVLVTEISSLWLARIELETAVESGALACVKVWGNLPDTSPSDRTTAEAAGVSFAQANTVLGNTFTIAPGSVTFGSYASGTFTAAGPTIPNDGTRACVVYATVDVPGLWNGLGGAPRSIQARATARYDSSTSTPRLVRVTTYGP